MKSLFVPPINVGKRVLARTARRVGLIPARFHQLPYHGIGLKTGEPAAGNVEGAVSGDTP